MRGNARCRSHQCEVPGLNGRNPSYLGRLNHAVVCLVAIVHMHVTCQQRIDRTRQRPVLSRRVCGTYKSMQESAYDRGSLHAARSLQPLALGHALDGQDVYRRRILRAEQRCGRHHQHEGSHHSLGLRICQ